MNEKAKCLTTIMNKLNKTHDKKSDDISSYDWYLSKFILHNIFDKLSVMSSDLDFIFTGFNNELDSFVNKTLARFHSNDSNQLYFLINYIDSDKEDAIKKYFMDIIDFLFTINISKYSLLYEIEIGKKEKVSTIPNIGPRSTKFLNSLITLYVNSNEPRVSLQETIDLILENLDYWISIYEDFTIIESSQFKAENLDEEEG